MRLITAVRERVPTARTRRQRVVVTAPRAGNHQGRHAGPNIVERRSGRSDHRHLTPGRAVAVGWLLAVAFLGIGVLLLGS